MKRSLPLVLLPAFCLLAMGFPAKAQPIINEIMYHPPSTNLLEQWVELYNPGTNAVDLTGWKFVNGIQFGFPSNTVLSAGGYLVVAADRAIFATKFPGVTNVAAADSGPLEGHTLELDDNFGQPVQVVGFHNDGDWAVRVMGAVMYNHQGWEWFALHDGYGSSLELINPQMPNSYAHNWGSNKNTNATPGRVNSILQTNVAPFIAEVEHNPIIPQSSDSVTISARIVDEHTNGLTVTLNYRLDRTASFTSVPMFDDGSHGDGLPSDGIFSAILPPQTNTTVVEFFLQARDLESNLRTYPAYIPPTSSTRTANLLYQVDNQVYAGAQPIYRIIMTEIERAELYALGRACPDSDSDAQMNATWITQDNVVSGGTTTQSRYNVGVRNRGHGSRQANPNNYHLEIPSDRTWKKQSGINLNSQYAHSQLLGSAVFRRMELPMPDSRAVQVRINSTNLMVTVGGNSYGSYAANEQYNNDFVKRAFPLDDHGNSYRGIRDQVICDPSRNSVADFTWHGTNYADAVYANAYFKQNNLIRNDWSDLIDLLAVLNSQNGHLAANYVADMQQRINVEEWMRYMAVNTLLDNNETCPANGIGDDYALYRGTNDTRFLLLPYDMDTVMGRGTVSTSPRDGIFRMTPLAVMDKFMKTPQFAPIYYRLLKTLAEGAFSSAQMNPFLDQLLNNYVPQAAIDTMKAFNASHVAYCLSQIPLTLSVSNSLTSSNGFPYTTTPTVSLTGGGNAIDTRSILVNGAPATWTAWQGTWSISGVTLRPGVNKVLVQALNSNAVEFARTYIDIWYDRAAVATATINAGSNFWSTAGGPYLLAASAAIPAGTVVRIQPGTTVYFGAGAALTVNGQLLAEGTDSNRIHFTRQPGGALWGSVDFINTTVESRLAYVDFDFCGGTTTSDGHNAEVHVNSSIVFIDHCTWPPTPAIEYISFNGSSFIVQNCYFPSYPQPTSNPANGQPELLHGVNGIPVNGYGIFRDNYFGHTWGFNDTIDFTGGNRPSAILQFINNVFDGASDDCLDLDSTDAWIEGNIFMHVHRDPARTDNALDTGSAISGGVDFVGQNSDWTIINNIFYDVDHVFLNKGNSTTVGNGGGRVAFLYNTVIHVAREYSGSTAAEIAAFVWSDDSIALPDPAVGSGLYAANNIIYDCSTLQRLYDPAHHTVIMDNNILSVPWSGPGSGNQVVDPLLNLGVLKGTAPTNVTVAQVRQAAQLRPGSPAIGAGFGGLDLGGFQPHGIAIAGEPQGVTTGTSATLTVGPGGTFNWGTTAPQKWGWTAFKWKLDNGAFSAEIPFNNNSPFTTPPTISLSGLANGPHTVYVIGKNDAPPGYYQDDAFVYPATAGISARTTTSHTWTVNTSLSGVIINEVLAANNATLTNGATTPDLIELYNPGAGTIDLSGMGLTDNATLPYKYTFPAGTTLAPGAFLVLFADSAFTAPGIHTGFSLKQGGDDVSLFDKPASGSNLLDSVTFGIQVTDYSIGRKADGTWTLCKPTFGSPNIPINSGDGRTLKINEWLTDAQFAATHDFVELYNPDPVPAALGGLYLSDAAGAPARSQIAPLSFVAGNGVVSFTADGNAAQGADHLNFKLSPDVGMILLSAQDLSTIDVVTYGPQQTDVSQGRSPNGSDIFTTFAQPTEGGPNPGPRGGTSSVTNITRTAVTLLTIQGSSWKYMDSTNDLGTAWQAPGYPDGTWSNGFGLFGFETTPAEYLPFTFQTYIPPPQSNGHWTVYYRTHFQWSNELAGYSLVATNYIDDGVSIYLNGSYAGGFRLTPGATYSTPATTGTEGVPDILTFPVAPMVGDNVLAAEVHQVNLTSSDDVFGMNLVAIKSVTNIIVTSTGFTPVVLNEILADNETLTNSNGRLSDWVELYNPSTNSFDLADVSLSDNPDDPRKWVFPANSIIGANGYLIIYCDPNLPVSSTNTGFGLNTQGQTVYLFDKMTNGGGLIDSIRFGLQTPDFAIGRVPNGTGNWTLTVPTRGTPNTAAGLGSINALRVNEWMANPSSGDDWFEIYNTANSPVALGGLFLTDNLADHTQSPIHPLSFIGSGGNGFVQFIADGNRDKGVDHVNFKLSNSGEQIGIYSPSGVLLNGITFGAQAKGVSQGRFPDGGATIVSFPATPSPAESNFLPLPNAVINEVLSHTDPPLEDAVEIYNPTLTGTNIGGWYLSNSKLNFKKYRIADGTILSPNGYLVLYEYQFGASGSATAFTLNSAHGDSAILSAADSLGNLTGYRTKVKFGATENGVSLGRYQTSVGVDFTAMSQRTFGVDNPTTVAQFRTGTGLTNAYPKVGPIVINEIMYHPVSGSPPTEEPEEEFLELKNITGSTVQLFDPSYPTNTWKLSGGVGLTFPTNVTLAGNGFLLLVGFNPVIDTAALASFRTKYGVPPATRIFGPWSSRLTNSGDSIELYKPDAVQLPPHPDAGFVPYILVDRVNYLSTAPWNTNANGTGQSLQRIVSSNYGNDPVNWTSAAPTAGTDTSGAVVDSDGDGMADSWEMQYFGTLARNGTGDFDSDGVNDLNEYFSGTDPTNPNSRLVITSQIHSGTTFVLQFSAIAGKTYSVFYRTDIASGTWTKLGDYGPLGANGNITATDSGVVGKSPRFYRVVTPNQ